jgi:hypothetical protein
LRMANLEPQQILELLEKPKNRKALAACNKHHARLRMHTVAALNANDVGEALVDFKKWLRSYLPSDKADSFEKLMGFPLPTVQLTSKAFKELKRIFEAENKHIKLAFKTEGLDTDFEQYDQTVLRTEQWLTGEYWNAVKSSVSSFVVVDLPEMQVTAKPEPYAYVVDTKDVYSVAKKNGIVEHLAFHPDSDKQKLILLDSAAYRVFVRVDSNSAWKLETENTHALGYCPAFSLWDTALDSTTDSIQQHGPITGVLEMLDKFVFWHYATMYYETYGSFPITWEYAVDCNFVDDNGTPCENGYISVVYNTSEGETLKKEPCPKCSNKSLAGPGTVKTVAAPQYKDDADARNPAGFINVDAAALNFSRERMQERESSLIAMITGKSGEGINDKAINEKQVRSLFESKQDVLMDLKRNIEVIQQKVLQTVAHLRYGTESLLAVSVNRGDEFYVRGEDAVAQEYAVLKEAGMPQFIIAQARKLYNDTKYRSNDDLRLKMRILANLEPYPELTVQELLAMAQTGVIKQETALLKAGFDYYIKRFEREQLPVEQFGSMLEMDKRIDTINTILYTYVKDDQNTKGS